MNHSEPWMGMRGDEKSEPLAAPFSMQKRWRAFRSVFLIKVLKRIERLINNLIVVSAACSTFSKFFRKAQGKIDLGLSAIFLCSAEALNLSPQIMRSN